MVTDAWEPIDFLAEFRERETCLREVTELLKEKAQSETGKLWAHHEMESGVRQHFLTERTQAQSERQFVNLPLS